MRIKNFKITNFKNIKYAECQNVPDFLVICGSNGSGKSSILEALMTAKETIGSYGGFTHNPNCVSANSEQAIVNINFDFTDAEMSYLNGNVRSYDKKLDGLNFDLQVSIDKQGNASASQQSFPFRQLFSRYAKNESFFDFFSAHRFTSKISLGQWNPGAIGDEQVKNNLSSGSNKFNSTKQYLAGLKMSDLQNIQRSQNDGTRYTTDSLKPIKDFFNSFFAPMQFDDVYLDKIPFQFLIQTPIGKIDIDELSSGEKEILNTFIHFHQLNPTSSIVLFDEPDVHLHTELERRYLRVLKELSRGNQFLITTHSPEMMIEAGEESLYTVVKYQKTEGENQFIKVSNDSELHNVLSDVMGSSGFVSLNRKIIFIEGESSSTDISFYERMYPKNKFNMTFIPAGDSTIVKNVSDKVYYLLDHGPGFQKYYCLIDGDIESRHSSTNKLFKLPVYHVENYLLDEDLIYSVSQAFLGTKLTYKNPTEVVEELKVIVLSEFHMRPFTKALLDSKIYGLSEKAKDLIFQNKFEELKNLEKIDFTNLQEESLSIVSASIANDSWKKVCKGRDIIKRFCGVNGLKYEHFRNALIDRIESIPDDLNNILIAIMND